MITVVDQLKLAQSLSLDFKYKIESLSDLDTVEHAYVGMLFFSEQDMTLYQTNTLKQGYLIYATNNYSSIQPSGVEYVDWESVPDFYVDTYSPVGSGTQEVLVTSLETPTSLISFTSDTVQVVFISSTREHYYRKTGAYPANSGAIAVQGQSGQYWVPSRYFTTGVDQGIRFGVQTYFTDVSLWQNRSVLNIKTEDGSNTQALSIGAESTSANGIEIVNIDYVTGGVKGYSPEIWMRSNMPPTMGAECAGFIRAQITGDNVNNRQIGSGVLCYLISNKTSFFGNGTPYRDDAIMWYSSNNVNLGQGEIADLRTKKVFYTTGTGGFFHKGVVHNPAVTLTDSFTLNTSNSVYYYTGSVASPLVTIPPFTEINSWGFYTLYDSEITIINHGTQPLTLSMPIYADNDTPITVVGNLSPDNVLKIKNIGNKWVKIN